MKKGTYEARVFQHKHKPLVYALWSDNNIVKTLSNFHTPKILPPAEGLLRKKYVDGDRQDYRSEVSCTTQNKDYSTTFHLIDKGNKNEASYILGGKSQKHNWTPKLVFCLFNMALNNDMKVYQALAAIHTPGTKTPLMCACINELAHCYIQSGAKMW